MIYRVRVMPVAEAAIDDYVGYLATDRQSPLTARRALQRIRTAIAKLEAFPHAAGRALEDKHRDYLIRFRVVDRCRLLYHVDDAKREVSVIGFRHSSQSERPEVLPASLD